MVINQGRTLRQMKQTRKFAIVPEGDDYDPDAYLCPE